MKIAFITDGGLEMGMGHVYRSITLAEELRHLAGTDVYFITYGDELVVKKLEDSGFSVFKLENDMSVILHLKNTQPDIVIIDRLDLDEIFVKDIREGFDGKIVIFGNLSSANQYADMVINSVIGSDFKNRRFRDEETGTLYFYGPKYLVLRKEFYEFKKKKRAKSIENIRRVLLIFGGSDASNLTSRALDSLLKLNYIEEVDVLLGPHFIYEKEVNSVLEKHLGKRGCVHIFKDVKNVAEMMDKADLVVTSPGLSIFEAFCVGTPVIAIRESQLHDTAFGDFINTFDSSVVDHLEELIFDNESLEVNTKYIEELEVGDGKNELIEEIVQEVKK